jgi:hypothetical protein
MRIREVHQRTIDRLAGRDRLINRTNLCDYDGGFVRVGLDVIKHATGGLANTVRFP